MPRRPLLEVPKPLRTMARLGMVLACLLPAAPARPQSAILDTDRIDITGRQNLTLGSGARAYGMGGAFLARADDATAASWNPAGLSYLRLPELTFVGAANSFDISRGPNNDNFRGQTMDFAAFTWPVTLGSTRGAVQLSYQRAVSFDGRRNIVTYEAGNDALTIDNGRSNGGFDVLALGVGLRLTRSLRAGFTVNRWVNGYEQVLNRNVYRFDAEENRRPRRQFNLDFRPHGTNLNVGLMWTPVEPLNIGAVYKTGFRAQLGLRKSRLDPWMIGPVIEAVTVNEYSAPDAQLEFPASTGVGVSWRPHDKLTVSADATLTRWSRARIYDYFDVIATRPGSPQPPPERWEPLEYPSRLVAPTGDGPSAQQDKQELRAGVEYVLIKGQLKVPLRAGYFNDRQITRDLAGAVPRFNGFTAGVGVVLGSVLLDVAYVYEFGKYYVANETTMAGNGALAADAGSLPPLTQRNALTTQRLFASIIYRFSGRP